QVSACRGQPKVMLKNLSKLKGSQYWLVILVTFEFGCSGLVASHEQASKPAAKLAATHEPTPQLIQGSADRQDGIIRKISGLPTDTEYCPDDFQFITDRIGWLFCSDWIWQTTDGSQTWERMSVANIDSGDYASFFFVSPQVGWCYSHAVIQQTEDGGHHWTRIPNPLQGRKGSIETVKFLKDGKTGWLAGSEWEPIPSGASTYDFPHSSRTDGKNAVRGMIFYTTDGGRHWQKQSAPIRLGFLVTYFYISENNQVWALCDFDLLHLVGNTWKKVDFTKAKCPNSQLLK